MKNAGSKPTFKWQKSVMGAFSFFLIYAFLVSTILPAQAATPIDRTRATA